MAAGGEVQAAVRFGFCQMAAPVRLRGEGGVLEVEDVTADPATCSTEAGLQRRRRNSRLKAGGDKTLKPRLRRR